MIVASLYFGMLRNIMRCTVTGLLLCQKCIYLILIYLILSELKSMLICCAFQVKIWFQNKRSKFKKLLKQGSNPHESDPLPGSIALSPRSPAIPPIWDVSASSKGVNMSANSYMPGYSHWYSSPHQDSMQR